MEIFQETIRAKSAAGPRRPGGIVLSGAAPENSPGAPFLARLWREKWGRPASVGPSPFGIRNHPPSLDDAKNSASALVESRALSAASFAPSDRHQLVEVLSGDAAFQEAELARVLHLGSSLEQRRHGRAIERSGEADAAHSRLRQFSHGK